MWYPPDLPVDHAYQTICRCRLVRNKRFLFIYDSLPINGSTHFESLGLGPDDVILVQCRSLRPDVPRWSRKQFAQLQSLHYADEDAESWLDDTDGDVKRATELLSNGFLPPAKKATSPLGEARRQLLDDRAALPALMRKFQEDINAFLLTLGLDPKHFGSDPI
jgi:hypothetical protein